MVRVLKVALAVVVVLGISGLVYTTVSAQQGAAPKPHDMTGCLAKGDMAGQYKLTGLEKGPKTVDIIEVDKEVKGIDAHVGHRVTITGTAVAKPADGKGEHYMRITAFKHVAPTCP
jgi:hypothetical protein